jgi:hypothetical protein
MPGGWRNSHPPPPGSVQLDTAKTAIVPGQDARSLKACQPYQNHAPSAKTAAKSVQIARPISTFPASKIPVFPTLFRMPVRYLGTALLRENVVQAAMGAQSHLPVGLDAQTLVRFAAGRVAVLPFFARHSCQATSIGAATAIDEYVPIRIPTTSANEKPFSTWPPNT